MISEFNRYQNLAVRRPPKTSYSRWSPDQRL